MDFPTERISITSSVPNVNNYIIATRIENNRVKDYGGNAKICAISYIRVLFISEINSPADLKIDFLLLTVNIKLLAKITPRS